MPVMLQEIYKALIIANVPEDQAAKAASELAQYESRFAKIESDLLLLKWMLGLVIASNLGILLRVW